jgi:hypothetical protein
MGSGLLARLDTLAPSDRMLADSGRCGQSAQTC